MVREICDSFEFYSDLYHFEEPNTRYITYEYKTDNANDNRIVKLIYELLSQEQDRCDNCIHYKDDGCFCGYNSHSCDIHGNLEWVDHPHHNGDGSKCEDYKRKK